MQLNNPWLSKLNADEFHRERMHSARPFRAGPPSTFLALVGLIAGRLEGTGGALRRWSEGHAPRDAATLIHR